MDIEYRVGNLISAPLRVIAHGCNAQGVMGSGVAKAIRDRYPEAYRVYREQFEAHGLKLGEVVWADLPDRIVANMITQERFGRDGARYVDYPAIEVCIWRLNLRAQQDGILEIGMPLIGAGLGGGEWRTIASIIERFSKDFRPVIYTLDGVVPDTSG